MTHDLQDNPVADIALGASPIMGRAATHKVITYIPAIIARVLLMLLLACLWLMTLLRAQHLSRHMNVTRHIEASWNQIEVS